jgi:fermentation-respiration switch protein FrsA (DUF1100 family)
MVRSVPRTWRLTPAVVLLVGCAGLPRPGLPFERSIVFHPGEFSEGGHRAGDAAFEDAWFKASDGTKLHGWFASADKPRAVVLYCHGNAGTVADRRDVLTLFRDRFGASILLFDYRGFGRSEGSPSEAGVLDDARAARRWLVSRAGVAEADIVVVGNSLGGGVAVDLAADSGARGLILENTFTSVPDVAAAHVPLFPAGLLMKTRLDSLAKIGRYHGPLLQTHGDADEVIPIRLGKQLFDAANGPKRFVVDAGGGHNDLPTDEYLKALDEFLGTLPARD